ncbi:MAG: hypothetical protein IRY83_14975 [Chloroflexi bacterium]|nr:hypothetical protein [Chloroflexota bacterium]
MDALEAEAWRRAVDGVERPVYQNGQRVGAVREYSDTLLIFLLKGGRPQKYRERYELSGPQSQPLLQPVADALLKVYGTDADDQSPQ